MANVASIFKYAYELATKEIMDDLMCHDPLPSNAADEHGKCLVQ